MDSTSDATQVQTGGDFFLRGGGDMGALIRGFDWSSTPLGGLDDWPQSLRVALGICLNARFPCAIYWGTELCLLYNDAWRRLLGSRHPAALGRSCRGGGPDLWPAQGSLLEAVLERGEAAQVRDSAQPACGCPPGEDGCPFFYSPIPGENGAAAGVLVASTECPEGLRPACGVAPDGLFSAGELLAQAEARIQSGRPDGEDALALRERCSLYRLYELEQRFRRYAEHLDAVLWLSDLRVPRLLYASPAYEKLWGRPRADLYANFFEWMEAIVPEDRQRVRVLFFNTVLDDHYDTEYRIVRPDGSYLWIRDRGFSVRDETGRVMYVAGFAEDITERKRTEMALRASAAALEEADRRKNEFLAMLAHELRNPLAPIRNAVRMLRLNFSDVPELNQLGDMISRQVAHLSRLVDDLLDISRISRGKLILTPEPLELQSVFGTAVESVRALLEAKQHRLTVQLPDEPLWVNGDTVRLIQVFTNLLHNAVKFTGGGGCLTLAAEPSGGEVVVRVRDNGAGIPAELLPRVFDLFAQGNGRDRAQGGLGIGLALVRNLVALHGGRVEVRSEGPGRGSEFSVRLPLLAGCREPAAAPPAPATPAAAGGGLRVLVVDDNVDAVESLAMLLELEGHRVRMVHDGPAALDAARTFRPQAVLLDIGLPGMSGYEVARRLRADPDLNPVRLIAVSGYGSPEDKQRSREAGFDLHLVKPVEPADLLILLAG
jgi:PAS domain S-box-containing protein